MLRIIFVLLSGITFLSPALGDESQLAGVPMKHKMASSMQCTSCHGNTVSFEIPSTEKCVACHGPMANIKTKPNPRGKNPHQSAHYADTVDCVVCHSEHKPSQDLCSTCHTVQFSNFR